MADLLQNQLYVLYGLSVVIILLIGLVIRLNNKVKKLLIGKNAKSLEDSIENAKKDLESLNTFKNDVIKHFSNVEKRLERSVQSVETIRFNPFKGTGDGGNQSFSTAIINQKGSGVVISSLYSRDRISVFSKPIENFESQFELTEEESEVLNNSKNSLSK